MMKVNNNNNNNNNNDNNNTHTHTHTQRYIYIYNIYTLILRCSEHGICDLKRGCQLFRNWGFPWLQLGVSCWKYPQMIEYIEEKYIECIL